MLERAMYKNHCGESISFGENGIFLNKNALHDYKWNTISNNSRIIGFNKGIVEMAIPVVIVCNTEQEGIEKRNLLHEVCEKDVLAMKYGTLMIGDYYLKCFIKASKKTDYLTSKKYMYVTLTVTTDSASWINETTTIFRKALEDTESGGFLDFAYDFPFDFTSCLNSKPLLNGNFIASAFRMIIYGVCKNPEININGHAYQVNVELSENEYLTIDSIEKTIILTKYNGQKVNKFNDRNRDSYIFEKIPVGENVVTWEGDFGFDVILLEERSEPKWI